MQKKSYCLKKSAEEMKTPTFLKKPYDAYKKDTKKRAENMLIADTSLLDMGFKLRQNHETAWIGREITAYLKDLCNFYNKDKDKDKDKDRVYVTRGVLTAHMRNTLGLNMLIADIRKEEGKPVFDNTGNIMDDGGTGQGAWHDRQKEHAKKVDKRIDYRHHALDAAVIGLVDRDLFNKATHYYKKNLNKYGQPTLKGFEINAKIDATLRNELKKRLKNYVVWHKQDHYPIDNFFDDTIYSTVYSDTDKKEKFVVKKTLTSLIKKTGGKLDKKTVLDSLSFIVGEEIRKYIIDTFKARYDTFSDIKDEKARLESALCGKDDEDGIYFPPHTKNKIKRVKMYHKVSNDAGVYTPSIDKVKNVKKSNQSSNPTPKDNSNTHPYVLRNKGYACVEIDKDEKGADIFRFIPLHIYWSTAYQRKLKKTHQDIIRIYKNDILYYHPPKDQEKSDYYVVEKLNESWSALICRKTTESNESKKNKESEISIGKKKIKDIKLISQRGDLTDNQ